MAQGRKPKDLTSIFHKNSPNYAPNIRKNSPEEQKAMDKMVKDNSNFWRNLRRQGYTERYFEYEARTDPELMGRVIPPEELEALNEEYKDCLDNFDLAANTTLKAQKSGALSTKKEAEKRMELCKQQFPDVLEKIRKKEITPSQGAQIIFSSFNEKSLADLKKYDWLRTFGSLRKNLSKLAKAVTPKNK